MYVISSYILINELDVSSLAFKDPREKIDQAKYSEGRELIAHIIKEAGRSSSGSWGVWVVILAATIYRLSLVIRVWKFP
jgi:hypothetical protein